MAKHRKREGKIVNMKSEDINEYIRTHHQTESDAQIGKRFGMSKSAIEHRRIRMQLLKEKNYQEFNIEEELKERKEFKENKSLERALKESLDRIALLEQEKNAILEIRENTKGFTIEPKESSKTGEAVAIALASDWHVEEIVRKDKVNDLNEYNLGISKSRAEKFFQNLLKLIRKEQQDIRINTLILALLGDFITSNIHDELKENCALRPIEAIIYTQNILISGLDFILNNSNLDLIIPCHVGNHSRITKKVHQSTEQGNSLEYFMFHNLKKYYSKNRRVNFVVAEGYHTYIEVFGFTLRFHHGHNVVYGGGVGGLTIPLIKAINTWNLTKRADQDFLGHFHQYTPHRRFTVNGSMIGYSPFALSIKGEFEPPQQAFCLYDKRRGKTVQIPILFT